MCHCVKRNGCDFPIGGGYFINFSDCKNLTKWQYVLMPLWRMTTIDIIQYNIIIWLTTAVDELLVFLEFITTHRFYTDNHNYT